MVPRAIPRVSCTTLPFCPLKLLSKTLQIVIFTIPVQKTLYTNFNGCAWSEADIAHQSVNIRATSTVAASIRPREITAPAIDQNTPLARR